MYNTGLIFLKQRSAQRVLYWLASCHECCFHTEPVQSKEEWLLKNWTTQKLEALSLPVTLCELLLCEAPNGGKRLSKTALESIECVHVWDLQVNLASMKRYERLDLKSQCTSVFMHSCSERRGYIKATSSDRGTDERREKKLDFTLRLWFLTVTIALTLSPLLLLSSWLLHTSFMWLHFSRMALPNTSIWN